MVTTKSVLVAVSEQISSHLDDEVVILSLADGTYYGLNPIGARIWDIIQEPTTLGELVSKLADEYSVDHATCEQDVADLVHKMVERGLIEVEGGEVPGA